MGIKKYPGELFSVAEKKRKKTSLREEAVQQAELWVPARWDTGLEHCVGIRAYKRLESRKPWGRVHSATC